MRTLARVVVGCVLLGSLGGANQGCGCGPIQGAYFTSEVLRYTPEGWLDQPSLLQPRTFATAIPLADGEHYLVVNGFTAEHDGDPADEAHTIELCSVVSGCALYGETEETNEEYGYGPQPGAAYLPDGTVISHSFIVHEDANGAYALAPTTYTSFVQVDGTVVAERDGILSVLVDGTSLPRVVGTFAGFTLAAAVDATHVLMLSTDNTIVVDLMTGTSELGPGPGPDARIGYPIALSEGAMVLGLSGALRYSSATKTWSAIPSLAGETWTVELAFTDGAILSVGDPDPDAARPYHLFLYDATNDSVTPLPQTPPFDLGATWLMLRNGHMLRIGGAKAWFDTVSGLASA